jgi:hypothetical protein
MRRLIYTACRGWSNGKLLSTPKIEMKVRDNGMGLLKSRTVGIAGSFAVFATLGRASRRLTPSAAIDRGKDRSYVAARRAEMFYRPGSN